MKNDRNIVEWRNKILSGDRIALSRAITLAESAIPEDRIFVSELLSENPRKNMSIRIAISGPPGVGKSTFINQFGLFLTQNSNIAVLTIDPTSPVSGGSILGDKTRMQELDAIENAYIRPSPSGLQGGGVAVFTPEVMNLCEMAGFDIILVETVGVGQSEIAARQLCDHFILLMSATAGDELQGIKRGIMELADSFIFNKSDITSPDIMNLAIKNLTNALHLLRQDQPLVFKTSSLSGNTIPEIWSALQKRFDIEKLTGTWFQRRNQQYKQRFRTLVNNMLLERFHSTQGMDSLLLTLETEISNESISPAQAVEKALRHFFKTDT